MRRVDGKIMSSAMISRSCANFLADSETKPGLVQSGGAIAAGNVQRINFIDDGWWSETHMKIRRRGLVSGTLEHTKYRKYATLDLAYEWCRFRESRNGYSFLTLFGMELPLTICCAVSGANRNLCEIADFSKLKPWFFIRANPKVLSVRNVVRLRDRPDGTRRRSKLFSFG